MPIIDLDLMDGHASYSINALGHARTMRELPIMVMTMMDVVQAVTRRCQPGDLRRLRIFGHGNAGRQGLGNSRTGGGAAVTAPPPGISWDWMLLCEIAHCFGRDGFLDLMGCDVGGGLAGKAYVSRLAQVLGVPVRAGRGPQSSAHNFDNAWIEAVPGPGGSVRITEHTAVTDGQLLNALARPPRRR